MSPEAAGRLALRVLGPVRLERESGAFEPGARREQTLLALLAAEARPMSRARLAAMLWPDAGDVDARGRMRRLLHELSSRVGHDTLVTDRQTVVLADDVCAATDLASLRRSLAQGLYRSTGDASEESLAALEHAAHLAAAEFAEGLALDECDELSAWLERQRESLRQARAQVLAQLVTRLEGAQQHERALHHAQDLVAIDSLNEAAQRQLIRLYAAVGQPHAALQQFERCREVLHDELGVEPEAATLQVAGEVRAHEIRAHEIRADEMRGRDAATTTLTDNPPAPVAVRYTRSGDVHLAYQVLGSGPLDVLLISGFVSNLEQAWEPGGPAAFFLELARDFRLILYDRRGVGLSDRTVDPADTSVSSADALSVLDAVGSRRALVFAVSEGGPIAIRLAVEHPERVAGLALWATLARGTAAHDYPWALTAEQFERWLDALVAQWGRPAAIDTFAPDHASDPLVQRWWARMLRLGSSPRCMQAVLRTLALSDVRALLPQVRVPTLVMHRTGDRAVRVDAGRQVATAISGAQWLELPGTAHWWWLGETAPIIEAIKGFAQRLADSVER
ncbi:DNA-binding SARP family transcriptional activator/pimeloyl-ACP methyl ester carboxylesterase [Lysobacter niabensis]|uniref:DNA-binding SARP family transcriptional activator/pimeloyl-ACP methyl ester carboxylesterase n=1 Tax=Agrilutibacter niabensis TaxID=380628 RepID=A0ABU1VMD4_9GAMM|nr:alpha/beta fold hydrolase [Lysobacter niabensis]MDR7098641.1 DNA-binding SARP family transcriptional activator/pimeloyl-ACP methyl ester carboxylesterase [Lysobacter niabensis]